MTLKNSQWKRLIRFVAKEDGHTYLGEPIQASIDVGLSTQIEANVLDTSSALTATTHTGKVKTVSKLLSPLAPEEVSVSRFLGLNYKDHAEECGMEQPRAPILFYKPPTSLSGPGEAIPIPTVSQPSSRFLVDYEAEFVAVLGRAAKNVSADDALKYVLGYSLGNDVSVRRHQGTTSQWGFSKSFDGSAPWGPALVNAELVDPQNVRIGASVNGNVLQDGNTSKQIFGLAETIAFLSQGTTLLPGSLIWTGTPAGVGFSRRPPITLNDGDKVNIFADSTFGTLCNTVKNDGNK